MQPGDEKVGRAPFSEAKALAAQVQVRSLQTQVEREACRPEGFLF